MASSSSSSPFAPAFSSQSWKYDVFLSFRGEDTRKTFVDHLYSALVQQGIHTYKDDETLDRGNSIGPSLMKAIEESHIAIIIFSEHYADSSWCLEELTHIMKCNDARGQIVIPIFYNVDPSQVRKQKGTYGEAFAKYESEKKNKVKWRWLSASLCKCGETFTKPEMENKTKVESWRKALVNASNLSGWEPKNIANGHESKGIKEIVEKISSRLQPVTSIANANLVGIAARMQGLISKLQIGSGGVLMVGIWGVGGSGKTTLASSVYGEISSKFDGCCFVENVREESRRHGLGKLKDEILSKMEASNTGGGRGLINKTFRHRKVLLVLDDVDHLDHLEALAGSPDWFGEGSRVIITTRDEHLLKAHKVLVHNISLLKGDDAIKLFQNHAQRDSTSIMEDYEQLSKEVVSYAGGLPLALKVLGSCLCDKNIEQWRSALARLKKTPDANILEKLKISFDGLTKDQKDLFLDIACFFRWERKDSAMEVLDACGFHPVIGVEELRQKALITISEYGEFDMHDLVQEMAHYIVRGEHPNNPEKHSRIWKREDVLTICAMDATMEHDMIEAIIFKRDYSEERSSQPVPPIVGNMKNLRWIDWGTNRRGDSTSPLPINFPPRELRCLMLNGISQKQLWEGYKYLPNLRMMKLLDLKKLVMTPNFDGLPNLERFELRNSPEIEEIDASLGRLEGLVSLRIIECPHIKKFPSITRIKKLETLSYYLSPGLFELSEIQQKMDNLPHNINHIKSWFFRRDLKKLDLGDCNLGDEVVSSAVWELPSLQQLDLSNNRFSRLDFSLLRLPRLKWLDVSGCTSLIELSELPSSISVLKADYCDSLETLGDISHCKWLWKVSLHCVNRVNGDILVDSVLKGNAIEDHHICVALQHQSISKGVVDRFLKANTFTLRLPHDWYSDFCGFLLHVVTYSHTPYIEIIMKEEEHEVDEDPPFELWQEPNEAPTQLMSYVGYLSFSSLRRNACFDPTYNLISLSYHPSKNFSIAGDRLGVTLVPKKTKHHPLQTTKLSTDFSQFWDENLRYKKTFTIRRDSNSSIKIGWLP